MATNKFGEHQVFNSYLKIINVNKRRQCISAQVKHKYKRNVRQFNTDNIYMRKSLNILQ